MSPGFARVLLVALAFALVADPAHAAEAQDEMGGGWFWHLVNVLILLGLLWHFGREPVRSFFSERRRSIESEIADARRELEEAQSTLGGWRRRHAQLEREAEEIRTQLREQAEAQAQHTLEQARAHAERMRREAAAAVDQETRRARLELQAEAGALAVEIATSLLREHVSPEDRERLVEEFVRRVETESRREGATVGRA